MECQQRRRESLQVNAVWAGFTGYVEEPRVSLDALEINVNPLLGSVTNPLQPLPVPEDPDPRSDSVKPLALNYSRLGIMVPRRSRKANLCPKICVSIPKINFCWDEKFSLNDQNFYENRPSFIEVPRISHFRRKYRLHQKTCENKCKITLISVDILRKKWILNNFCENFQRHLCLDFPNYVLKVPHPRF